MTTQYSIGQLNDAVGTIMAGPGPNKSRWGLRLPVAEQMLKDAIVELELLRKQSEKICLACKVKYPANPGECCPGCNEVLTSYPVALAEAQSIAAEKARERIAFLEELVAGEYGFKALVE